MRRGVGAWVFGLVVGLVLGLVGLSQGHIWFRYQYMGRVTADGGAGLPLRYDRLTKRTEYFGHKGHGIALMRWNPVGVDLGKPQRSGFTQEDLDVWKAEAAQVSRLLRQQESKKP